MEGSKKRDWFLIRGLGREAGHWGDFPSLLAKSEAGGEVYCLDLPGCGQRYNEKSPTSITEIVSKIRPEYLNADSKRPKMLLSISLGGMVALEWLSQYPEDFDGAVLINTSVKRGTPFYQRLRPTAILTGVKTVLEPDVEKREIEFLDLTSNSESARRLARPHWVEIQKLRPVRRETLLRQLFAAVAYSPTSRLIENPVLLLCSQKDRIVNPVSSRRLQTHLDCKLVEHPWAGHDIPLDDPNWIIEQLKKWSFFS